MAFTNTINEVITKSKMEHVAPSIFSESAKGKLTQRYNFIPTITVVNELEKSGWLPVKATECLVRDEKNQGYQKHMIRFRNFDEGMGEKLEVGDCFMEMVLTNSHDGLSSFIFNLGLFRLACSNGMVVSESCFDSARIRHNSYNATRVLDICNDVATNAPRLLENVQKMDAIELTPDEQGVFASAARTVRFGESDVSTEAILHPRRYSDTGNSLWKTFNRVQENLEKGGIQYWKKRDDGIMSFPRRSKTREVKGIDSGMRLNQALWQLAEEMAKLKTATA